MQIIHVATSCHRHIAFCVDKMIYTCIVITVFLNHLHSAAPIARDFEYQTLPLFVVQHCKAGMALGQGKLMVSNHMGIISW